MPALHSKILGEGKPLVILHGFLGMGDNWKTLGKQFAINGYQVHLVDQRNHGRSFHSDAFSYTLLAEDLKSYCDQENLDHIRLIGHSMGGKTAMMFAAMYPEMVKKLIVVDIAPRLYPQHHQVILDSLTRLSNEAEALKSRSMADAFLETLIPEMGTRQFLLKNLYWVEPGLLGLRMNLESLIRNIEEIGKPLPEGAQFNNDTLFLKGDKSDYISEDDEKGIYSAFAKAKIKTIKNAGHWLHAENPKDFYAEVINFL